jgi:hypothetical protein
MMKATPFSENNFTIKAPILHQLRDPAIGPPPAASNQECFGNEPTTPLRKLKKIAATSHSVKIETATRND